MTKFLRSALGAPEPAFSHSIRQLEQAAGLPSTDIRLTSEITRALRAKILELGLDPDDTTGPELYEVLHQKLAGDEAIVRYRLNIPVDSPPAEVVGRVRQYVAAHDMPAQCFALKTSVAKRLLKKKPPRVAMKRLGYRSVDSMLKHEPPALLFAAALMAEAPSWHRVFREQYTKLAASDFESRKIALVYPKTKRWQTLAHDYVQRARHHILGFRELGAVVLLPMEEKIGGLAITTLLLVLEEMNGIRAYSSFVKLGQVKADFGKFVKYASISEPLTSAKLADQPVPWRMIQRYYARFKEAYHADIFEPHVQPEDLQWYNGEEALVRLEPSLRFWQETALLALLHKEEPVSLNILDVALNYSNHLPFGGRVAHFFRDNLWHELMIRYLHQENLEAAVRQQLSTKLTNEKSNQEALL